MKVLPLLYFVSYYKSIPTDQGQYTQSYGKKIALHFSWPNMFGTIGIHKTLLILDAKMFENVKTHVLEHLNVRNYSAKNLLRICLECDSIEATYQSCLKICLALISC